jgi:saccharopine dehydrogenase (NAD+, L-lysine forming)
MVGVMTIHIWIRAEERANEMRVPVTPDGVAALVKAGLRVTVEISPHRIIGIEGYRVAGASIAPSGAWRTAPSDAFILGLKELPEDGTPLHHRHIMFGHAFKGQPAGQVLLSRLKAGGGTLLDLEYLVNPMGRRVAAFGYWAGFAGAGVALLAYAAQQAGGIAGLVSVTSSDGLVDQAKAALTSKPSVIVIGALGRVGTGARDFCARVGLTTTDWDVQETASGGPFPEVLAHEVFLNAILAMPGCPVFVPASAVTDARALRVIGDIACDPSSDFNPIKVYDRVTDWANPALRVATNPPLDVVAIDNLPSLLPKESSEDFAAQLLPHLLALGADPDGVWARAKATFDTHLKGLTP